MNLTINGQIKEFSEQITLAELVSRVCPDPERVIAELNGRVVKSPAWPRSELKDQDKLELVALVGGG